LKPTEQPIKKLEQGGALGFSGGHGPLSTGLLTSVCLALKLKVQPHQ